MERDWAVAARRWMAAGLIAGAGCLYLPQPATADVITVTAASIGGYGVSPPSNSYDDFVIGYVFSGALSVSIAATGTVSICDPAVRSYCASVPYTALPSSIGPGGADIGTLIPEELFPLEEGANDAGASIAGADPSVRVGALIGVFVSASVVATPGFQARDADLTPVGIPATDLFFIGAGPFVFHAPEAGTLFLGVNDSDSQDNSGAFRVTIAEVTAPMPLPATAALLALGLVGIAATRRRV